MDELLTIQEVARLLHVDDMTVRRWIKIGALGTVELPGSVYKKRRIRRRDIEALPGMG